MLKQQILTARGNYEELDNYLKINEVKRIFLVCDGSLPFLKIGRYFDSLTQRTGIEVIKFSDITPNPLYESVVDGVRLFCEFGADLILAVQWMLPSVSSFSFLWTQHKTTLSKRSCQIQ